MAKRTNTATGEKSALKDDTQKSTLEFMESVQGRASDGTLDGALTAAGIPDLPKTTHKAAAKHFSKLVPFERSKFDYEKYCAALATGLVDKKSRKAQS